jgi:transcriptional regulator with XRE-family HTH domain
MDSISTADLDTAIGAKLRELRGARDMTQTQLGDAIGVTFQQVQKYEKGANRLSLSRAAILAERLGVSPVDFLPEEMRRRLKLPQGCYR